MDPMEILSSLENGDGECQPMLPDIDIDFLVDSGFNNCSPLNESAAGSGGALEDGLLCRNDNVSEAIPLFDFDSVIDFSSQNVDDNELQVDKSGVLSYLADPRPEDISCPTGEEDQPSQAIVIPESAPPDEKTTTKDANAALMENSMQSTYGPTSLLMQNEWQDIAALLPSHPENIIPSSFVNDVKMLPLDGLETCVDRTSALRTHLSSGDANFAPEVHQLPTQQCNSPKSLHSNARCPSQAFYPSVASSYQQSVADGSQSETPKTPLKQFKGKDGKMKAESLQKSLAGPSVAAAAASSSTPRKKTAGRRKMSATAHLSLEERKRLRAERNRESAEKSRMRRKQMILDLETNVQSLRDENRNLKAKLEQYQGDISSKVGTLCQTQTSASGGMVSGRSNTSAALTEALHRMERCKEDCPRTFNQNPNLPVIPLNVPPKRQARPL